jgi:branched-subunit amino acid aminotransferase/4-amino-4-deoxychorismate lyase
VKITSGMDPRLNQAGPTLIVLAEFKSPVYRDAVGDSGLSLITSSVRRFAPDAMDPKIHHCNLIQSIMAKIEANHAGADDAVMLDPRGFLAETNATHVFIVTNTPKGPLVETSRCVACPEGITRETVLELCEANNIACAERDISMTEVYRDAVGESGLSLITSSIRRFAPDAMDPKIHHCNLIQSIMAKIEANCAGADDAVMLDPRGFLAETNATHVFIVTDTPDGPIVETSRCVACPEGITRDTVLGLCRAHGIACAERDISMTEVYRANECFTTGTMGELAPVATVDGRSIGNGDRPVTERLASLYRDLTAREGTPVA